MRRTRRIDGGNVEESKLFLVVDLPIDAPAEYAEAMLAEPYSRDYWLINILPGPNGQVRAYFKHRALHPHADGERNRPNRDGKEAAALAIIQNNPGLSAPGLTELLKAEGISRGQTWVKGKKRALKK
jgi:hypothetical protein